MIIKAGACMVMVVILAGSDQQNARPTPPTAADPVSRDPAASRASTAEEPVPRRESGAAPRPPVDEPRQAETSGETTPLPPFQLPRQLLEAGWSVRSVEVPATPGHASAKPPVPGQGAAQQIVVENEMLRREVPRKDGSRQLVHAKFTLAIYPRERARELLPVWEAAYEAELARYRRLLENRPQTAMAPPSNPDDLLFWQTRDHVLLLLEDEVRFPESDRVKSAIKRELMGW